MSTINPILYSSCILDTLISLAYMTLYDGILYTHTYSTISVYIMSTTRGIHLYLAIGKSTYLSTITLTYCLGHLDDDYDTYIGSIINLR
jgi:hypothetical protein